MRACETGESTGWLKKVCFLERAGMCPEMIAMLTPFVGELVFAQGEADLLDDLVFIWGFVDVDGIGEVSPQHFAKGFAKMMAKVLPLPIEEMVFSQIWKPTVWFGLLQSS
jgi:hypothetical protein